MVETIPTVTYRLQCHHRFTFDDAAARLPYFDRLGVSHLYLSPILESRPGSLHGYDGTDFSRISEERGGENSFITLLEELQSRNMGAIVDIVPNHLTACWHNPYFRDILEKGPSSNHWELFDFFLDRHNQPVRITLPLLGKPLAQLIKDNEITCRYDGDYGFYFQYGETRYPLSVTSYKTVLTECIVHIPTMETDIKAILLQLCSAFEAIVSLPSDEIDRVRLRCCAAINDSPALKQYLTAFLREVPPSFLGNLLKNQYYELQYWKTGLAMLNYRRFFDIAELIALKMENPHVFDLSHAKLERLFRKHAPTLYGLRVDHIDGLADPLGYIQRLHKLTSNIWIEKIMSGKEMLRANWPVNGTTGYDYLNIVSHLFVNEQGFNALREHHRHIASRWQDFQSCIRQSKKDIAVILFQPELRQLVSHLQYIINKLNWDIPPTRDEVEDAILSLTAALPVYRTYITDIPSDDDKKWLMEAFDAIDETNGNGTSSSRRHPATDDSAQPASFAEKKPPESAGHYTPATDTHTGGAIKNHAARPGKTSHPQSNPAQYQALQTEKSTHNTTLTEELAADISSREDDWDIPSTHPSERSPASGLPNGKNEDFPFRETSSHSVEGEETLAQEPLPEQHEAHASKEENTSREEEKTPSGFTGEGKRSNLPPDQYEHLRPQGARATSREGEAQAALPLEGATLAPLTWLKTQLLYRPHLPQELKDWVIKWQQFTGPVMAKGMEDTALYRYFPLAGLNEVGGDAEYHNNAVNEFHQLNQHHHYAYPLTLHATATHDSKKGEDTRARLLALSECADEFLSHIHHWAELNKPYKSVNGPHLVPDAQMEYFIYQTLIGTWPLEQPAQPPVAPADAHPDKDVFTTYKERIKAYLTKALREAKEETSWRNMNTAYEENIIAFVDRLLDADRHRTFLHQFVPFAEKISVYGAYNSLAMLTLKALSPGIMDIYQGTELWDLSLVDPDNRRDVDFDDRIKRLDHLNILNRRNLKDTLTHLRKTWRSGDIKLWLTQRFCQLRRTHPDLFIKGDYIPLTVSGAHSHRVIAFLRRWHNKTCLAVVPRHIVPLQPEQDILHIPAGRWEDTLIEAFAQSPGNFQNTFTGARKQMGRDPIKLSEILDEFFIGCWLLE